MQALVGYRDYDDEYPIETIDFIEKEDFAEMQAFLRHLVAKGGDDWAEDVAGGLQVCPDSWQHLESSSMLFCRLIAFYAQNCYRYHSLSSEVTTCIHPKNSFD